MKVPITITKYYDDALEGCYNRLLSLLAEAAETTRGAADSHTRMSMEGILGATRMLQILTDLNNRFIHMDLRINECCQCAVAEFVAILYAFYTQHPLAALPMPDALSTCMELTCMLENINIGTWYD